MNLKFIAISTTVAVVAASVWIIQTSDDVKAGDRGSAIQLSPSRSTESGAPLSTDRATASKLNSGNSKIDSLWEEEKYDQAAEVYAAWLKENPAAALQYFSEMKPPLEVYHFLPSITDYLATLPPTEAMELAQSLKLMDPNLYFSAIRESLVLWNETERSELLSWIQTDADPGLAAKIGVSEVLGSNSEAVSEVMETFPEGEVKNQLASAILGDWLMKEPEVAVEYVNSAPQTVAFDRAALQYVDQIVAEDHDAAHSWASMIVSPDLRASILKELSENHRLTDCKHCLLAHEEHKNEK